MLSHITGTLFKHLGYNVIYNNAPVDEQWGLLRFGMGDVQVEVWEGTMAKEFNRFIELGFFLDAGAHSARTREEWWYPAYVKELCPGLPSWKALNQCAHLFATDETQPRGRYLAGPWEKPDRARIRALALNFSKVQADDASALWSVFEEAVSRKQPILLFNWTPNWVEHIHDGEFVEFPEWDIRCETDASWGLNPAFTYDCGNPKDGWLKKASSTSMPQTWPCAFELLERIDFDNEMLAQLAAMIEVEGLDYQQAAGRWLDQNRSVWQPWIPINCHQ